jgi:hypothetical protein
VLLAVRGLRATERGLAPEPDAPARRAARRRSRDILVRAMLGAAALAAATALAPSPF